MNTDVTKNSSRTDWERVDAMTDEEIDYSDIPPLDDAFFTHARLRLPHKKERITLQLDDDVVAWFKAQDDEWQRRMQAALRLYVETHRAYQ
ncbi:MAG: BrnA antitoxin family protein [Chloroflexi bacterium]|nr:BrnA antitoxin family protein [Chloroflexota bacterium]